MISLFFSFFISISFILSASHLSFTINHQALSESSASHIRAPIIHKTTKPNKPLIPTTTNKQQHSKCLPKASISQTLPSPLRAPPLPPTAPPSPPNLPAALWQKTTGPLPAPTSASAATPHPLHRGPSASRLRLRRSQPPLRRVWRAESRVYWGRALRSTGEMRHRTLNLASWHLHRGSRV